MELILLMLKHQAKSRQEISHVDQIQEETLVNNTPAVLSICM